MIYFGMIHKSELIDSKHKLNGVLSALALAEILHKEIFPPASVVPMN